MGELKRPKEFSIGASWWMVIAGGYGLAMIALMSFGMYGWALIPGVAFGYSFCNVMNLGYLVAQHRVMMAQDRVIEESRLYIKAAERHFAKRQVRRTGDE